MLCTRWYLPLLLLPFPTASPVFLILFIVTLTLHAKPCFYCIVLLSTLFLSSCYWQPFPMDTTLSRPWSENITTFGEALNSSLPATYTGPLPTSIRAVDRCWCDFTEGSIFDTFNMSQWEHKTVARARDDILRQHTANLARTKGNATLTAEASMMQNNSENKSAPSIWYRLKGLTWARKVHVDELEVVEEQDEDEGVELQTETPILPPKWIRPVYDLRPYGLSLVVDFRVSSQD